MPPIERRLRSGTAEALRLFHTARYLKPVQIYGRLWPQFDRGRPDGSPAPKLRARVGRWAPTAPRPVSLLARWQVRLLNEDGEIATATQWNDSGKPKLWLYNLHYFDDLGAPANAERRGVQRELVARWIAENPPGKGNGWDPYPVSVRIGNWIKWALAGEPLEPEWLNSLAMQTRWLVDHVEWHLLGNHVLANAKALVLAGLFFGGAEAEAWLRAGLSIYARELPEQILADGAHFELSPMYHAIILEDLLDLINAARTYARAGGQLFSDLPQITSRMRLWLAAMTHPDGRISFFNDSAFGIAASRTDLEAYAARLRLAPAAEPGEGLHHLAASGYVRVNCGQMAAILDLAAIGPDYNPGHAHADTLSFELSLGTERIVVNGGTSGYAPGSLRETERSTAAHSTVEVGGQSSSEVWSSFRVARRARVRDVSIDVSGSTVTVKASHDGYRRLPGRPSHRREWHFDGLALTIIDTVACRRVPDALSRLHLGQGVAAEAEAAGRSGRLITAGGRVLHWTASNAARIEPSVWSPEFGWRTATQTLTTPLEAGFLSMTLGWS